VIWITKKLSMYVFKKFPDGKLIGGKGASVRRIMTATVAITGPAGKSVKRRAGRCPITKHSSRPGINKEGRDVELATSLPLNIAALA
jgi:hypothetical protein